MIEQTERVHGEDRPDLPIVVGLHFMGSDPKTTELILFADLEGSYRFVFPQGAFPIDNGYSWFSEDFYDKDDSAKANVIAGVAADLALLLADLSARYPDAPPPIVVGVSQGGDLAAALAILHPSEVGFALAVAASLPAPLLATSGRRAPLHFFHGKSDAVVSIDRVRETVTALQGGNSPSTLTEYPDVGHAVPDQMRQDLHEAIQAIA